MAALDSCKVKLPLIAAVVTVFLWNTIPSFAQSGFRTFFTLSGPEKCWTVFHPFVARKALLMAHEAREQARNTAMLSTLDGDSLGGQVDAFRHAYWMARCAQQFAPNKALRLGKAHERGNYKGFKKNQSEDGERADSALCAMDLFNNSVGVELGYTNRNVTPDSLVLIVQRAILSGRMLIISKDETGAALDCSGKKLNPADFLYQWNIPKCLVSSDHSRLRN
ncbi:MAG: hypothetical protein RIQ47_586 [Bacteroidota bacterium]|jgi:hypothetical protein